MRAEAGNIDEASALFVCIFIYICGIINSRKNSFGGGYLNGKIRRTGF